VNKYSRSPKYIVVIEREKYEKKVLFFFYDESKKEFSKLFYHTHDILLPEIPKNISFFDDILNISFQTEYNLQRFYKDKNTENYTSRVEICSKPYTAAIDKKVFINRAP